MHTPELDVVTGAFGFTGKSITSRLLSMGRRVKTITGHPDRDNPFGEQVTAEPYNFDNPRELVKSLQGADRLFITYWIRFPHGHMTYDKAVENTKTLFNAAKEAGVRRVVYVSITNASDRSRLPYFKGKGKLEKYLMDSGLSYGIVRPTVVFGNEGILINNIAYLLRHFPMFAIPGNGKYKLQPIFVDDLAELAVSTARMEDNLTVDAAGPETFTFNDLVRLIADTVHSSARIVHMNPMMAFSLAGVIGKTVNDVVLTRDEVEGLMANLLISSNPPTGHTSLSEWLKENADMIGRKYLSELEKHYR